MRRADRLPLRRDVRPGGCLEPGSGPDESDEVGALTDATVAGPSLRTLQAEILAFHATDGCSNGPTEAVNLLIKSAWNGRLRSASPWVTHGAPAGGATTGRSRPSWRGSQTRA